MRTGPVRQGCRMPHHQLAPAGWSSAYDDSAKVASIEVARAASMGSSRRSRTLTVAAATEQAVRRSIRLSRGQGCGPRVQSKGWAVVAKSWIHTVAVRCGVLGVR